jgi:hypothetical protein
MQIELLDCKKDMYFELLSLWQRNKISPWLTSYFYLGLGMVQPVVDTLHNFWPLRLIVHTDRGRRTVLDGLISLLIEQLGNEFDATLWSINESDLRNGNPRVSYQHRWTNRWWLVCSLFGPDYTPRIRLETNTRRAELRLCFGKTSDELECHLVTDFTYILPLTFRFLEADIRWVVRLFLEICRTMTSSKNPKSYTANPPQWDHCLMCGKTQIAPLKCSRCPFPRYCSPACGKKDWDRHRAFCGALARLKPERK